MKRFVLAALFIGCVPVYPSSASSADEQKLAAANNGFAFNFLKELAKEQPAKNIFISPYSAAAVLQMVGSGAAGQTKTEMQQVLGTVGMSSDAVGAANKDLASSLNSFNTNVILTTANAIWYRQGILMKRSFTDANQRFFQATVKAVDFGNPRAAEAEINQWASDQTHGRIKGIADGMTKQNAAMVLANAVYFKGKWLETFDQKLTKQRLFHLASGGDKKVPMMERLSYFAHREGPECQVVRLPYKDRNLAMYIFLPDRSINLVTFLHTLNGHNWRRVGIQGYEIANFGTRFGTRLGKVVLPKFKCENGFHLIAPLKALGIRSAFDDRKADFSGISSVECWLSEFRQKTFVEVDEEGTEAAAATAIMQSYGAYEKPPNPFQMIVDRPFLFLIEDSQTGTILFMGLIFDPQG